MTKEEAAKKWCPLVRVEIMGDYWQASNGRDLCRIGKEDPTALTRCITTECMAWRWVDHDDRRSGFCGMAQ